MRDEAVIAVLAILIFLGIIIYCLIRFAKHIFLPKSRLHIAVGIMIVGLALFLFGGVAKERDFMGLGGFLAVVGLFATAMSIFIAKIYAEKYQPYLRKGKSTTAEQLMASLKKKDVDTVLFELNSLFERGYLPGFAVNMESHVVSPAAAQDAVKGVVKMVNRTVSTIKGTPETQSVCEKCGATIPDNGAANCEFCGSPVSR